MPKRSTHTYVSEENQDVAQLLVYYCLYCGQTALINDVALDALPKRKTDGSLVLETKQHMYKMMLDRGEQKLIKRAGGYERQFRHNCTKCNLPIAYQSVKDKPMHIFLIKDALSMTAKVSFNEVQVPGCIQPLPSGDVKMKVHVKIEGPRCIITDIGEDALEMTVKDCSHLGEDKAEAKQKDLLHMFLQKTLGLASKDQIKYHMGANMKTKIMLLKEIPPSKVYERLKQAMAKSDDIQVGYVDKHGVATTELFERMPGTEDEAFGAGNLRKRQKPTKENPFPDQPAMRGNP